MTPTYSTPARPTRVFFFRHGEAGNRWAWTGNDAERPLTKEGWQQVRRISKVLARLGLGPDLILTSPYVRAVQTAHVAAEALGLEDRLVIEPALAPGAPEIELYSVLRAHCKTASVMLVGHEPEFSLLIASLCGGGQLVLDKGAVAEVRLQGGKVPGALVWLAQPDRLLG